MRCNRFDGFPCPTDGKADAHVLCVRPALAHPNVTLRTHATVQRLEADASGRSLERVVVDHGAREEAYSADIVVVSCGAANSAALLLLLPTLGVQPPPWQLAPAAVAWGVDLARAVRHRARGHATRPDMLDG